MNWLALLTAMATLYDEMAKGGAKTEADKILATIVPVIATIPPIIAAVQTAPQPGAPPPQPGAFVR
jgi:hypothetical protein